MDGAISDGKTNFFERRVGEHQKGVATENNRDFFRRRLQEVKSESSSE